MHSRSQSHRGAGSFIKIMHLIFYEIDYHDYESGIFVIISGGASDRGTKPGIYISDFRSEIGMSPLQGSLILDLRTD